jgi:competence protein ComEC
MLLSCCVSDVKADVLVVGHHGSMTSSRKAFLDAVAASVFVISSGPMPYGQNRTVLPDPVIVSELESRGQLLRTNVNDAACAMKPVKIGPDADGFAGSCDTVRLLMGGTPVIQSITLQLSD